MRNLIAGRRHRTAFTWSPDWLERRIVLDGSMGPPPMPPPTPQGGIDPYNPSLPDVIDNSLTISAVAYLEPGIEVPTSITPSQKTEVMEKIEVARQQLMDQGMMLRLVASVVSNAIDATTDPAQRAALTTVMGKVGKLSDQLTTKFDDLEAFTLWGDSLPVVNDGWMGNGNWA